MSDEQDAIVPDVVRWTFTPEPERRDPASAFLTGLGWEVLVREEGQVVATLDEPEADLDATVEELWAAVGATFEVTHEELRRTEFIVYHPDAEAEGEPEVGSEAA